MNEITLFEVERDLIQSNKDEYNIKEEYNSKLKAIESKISDLEHKKEILMKNYNLSKIENAKRFLYTRGCKNYFRGEASGMVVKAIKDVTNKCEILTKKYLGCKDYSRFTGQGIICEYGMCPTYGTVIMKIGTTKAFRRKEITPDTNDYSDMIYFLNLLKNERSRDDILKDYE